MARKDEHKDRGDGVCSICFEEMPCAVTEGLTTRPRWAEDELAELLAESARQQEQRSHLLSLLLERLGQLGIEEDGRPIDVPGFTLTITLKVETLAQIVALIPTEEGEHVE